MGGGPRLPGVWRWMDYVCTHRTTETSTPGPLRTPSDPQRSALAIESKKKLDESPPVRRLSPRRGLPTGSNARGTHLPELPKTVGEQQPKLCPLESCPRPRLPRRGPHHRLPRQNPERQGEQRPRRRTTQEPNLEYHQNHTPDRPGARWSLEVGCGGCKARGPRPGRQEHRSHTWRGGRSRSGGGRGEWDPT